MFLVQRKYFQYILFMLVIVAYGLSIGNGFVWDDKIFMVGNRAYSEADFYAIFFGRASTIEFLPLRDLTIVLDYLLWGEFAPGFHLTNVIISGLTAVTVYHLCDCLLEVLLPGELPNEKRGQVALATSCLFILHPIQAQSVNFIGGRNVLLGGFFFYLSLLIFIKSLQKSRPLVSRILWAFSVFLFIAAMLSKATPVILPLVLLALIWCLPTKKPWVLVLPYFAVSGFFYLMLSKFAADVRIIRPEIMRFGILSLDTTMAKAACIPWFYLHKILWPFNFSPEYEPVFPLSMFDPKALLAASGLVLITILAVRVRHRFPVVLFSILYFYLTLIPVLNLLPSHTIVSDRYMFLPLLGVFLAITVSVYKVQFILRRSFKLVAVVPLGLVLTLLTMQQSKMWENEETLWKGAISSVPDCSRAYANLGAWYFSQKRYAEAFPLFKKAAEIDPSKPNLEFSKGMIEFRKKNYDAAMRWYQQGLCRNREHLPSLYFAGLAAMNQKKWREACGWFRKVNLSSDPDPTGYRKKSKLFTSTIIQTALSNELILLQQNLQAYPKNRILRAEYLKLLYDLGKYPEVLPQYQELVISGPVSLDIVKSVGIAYILEGDHRAARSFLVRAAADGDSESVIILARLAVRDRQYGHAINILEKSAYLRDTEAINELVGLWFRLGDVTETRRWLDYAYLVSSDAWMRNGMIKKKLESI